MIKRLGKKGKEWVKAREALKREYFDKGITTCELHLSGCAVNNFLSFAHFYKRSDPRCKHTFEQTLLVCVPCHQKIEYDRDLTRSMFEIFREGKI